MSLLAVLAAAGPPATATAAHGAGRAPQTRASAVPTSYAVSTRVVDGTLLTLRWNPCQPAVTYRVNTALAGRGPAARAAAVADVRAAFARLGRATGLTFTYRGGTTIVPTGTTWADHLGDAEVVVAWVDPRTRRSTLLGRAGAGYVAGTGGYSYKTWTTPDDPIPQAAIGRGFVVLNAADNAAFRPGFGAGTTRGQLLLHELGHVVGLKHVASSAQLMYPVLIPRPASAYRAGDQAGLARVGRAAGCIAVPTWVWVDR